MTERTPARHASVAGAFSVTPRADGLSGLLGPRKPATPAPEPTPSAPAKEEAPPAAPKRPAQKRRESPSPSSLPDDTIVNLPVYLPPDLLEAMTSVTTRRRTYADVLLDAFELVDDERLKAAFWAVPATPSPAGIPRKPVRRTAEPGIQRQFRVTKDQLTWIEAKTAEVQAPSRSALCVEVLRRYLDRSDPAGAGE